MQRLDVSRSEVYWRFGAWVIEGVEAVVGVHREKP